MRESRTLGSVRGALSNERPYRYRGGMERRGEFPRRFNLTPRCVVWDLADVEAWIEARKQAPRGGVSKPDVRLRKTRPVRAGQGQE